MARNNLRNRSGRSTGGIRQALWELFHPFRARQRRREEEQRARRNRERAGQKGEWRTRRELEKLPHSGCYYVFSDLSTHHAGNIDHLVVGPEGLIVVETKANRGLVEVEAGRRQITVLVDGKPLHRDVIRQVGAQIADLCEQAGIKGRPGQVSGVKWVVCFPAGKLGHVPSDLRPHLATPADLLMKVRRTNRSIDEEMVHAIARSIARLYGKQPDPQRLRHFDRVDAGVLPPGRFVADAVDQPMVDAAERDCELVAGFAAKRARLRVTQVMRV